MRTVSSFLLGMAAGAALLYTANNYHVVRSNEGLHLIAKQPARLGEIFIDVRGFSLADWAARPQLVSALVQANEQRLLGDSATRGFQQSMNQIIPPRTK
jgi:hypothetical protein